MSKPVFGLLAGLAVVVAAGRIRRGSFSRHAIVGARSEKAARERFAVTYPTLRVVRVEKATPGLRHKYVVVAEPEGSRSESLSEPVRKALAELPQEQVRGWRASMASYGIKEPTDADWRKRFAEAGLGALQFGAERGWKLKGSRAKDKDFGAYTWGLTPEKVIREAIDHHVGEAGSYPIEAHQGSHMLSHLLLANERAKISPFRFQGAHGRVGFKYGRTELVKLLAALKKLDNDMGFEEDMDDSPGLVRTDILQTLGIEEV